MKRVLAACALVLLAGCVVQSANPFYTKDAVITVSALNGRWAAMNSDGKPVKQAPWVFEDSRLTTCSESDRTGVLHVVYFKVGDATFADTTAEASSDSEASEWWSLHVRAMHCLSRVETNGNELVFKPLNYDWLARGVKEKTVALPFIKPAKSDDLLIFTPSSRRWMRFLREYGASDEAFPDKGKLVFRREGEGLGK